MTRPAAASHEPRWAQSWTGPELTANDISAVVDAAGLVVGEEAETWQQRLRQGKSTYRKDRLLSGRRTT
jgi:hypothetical protein